MRELRAKLGLSQQAFATSLGVSIASVSRWENGHRPLLLTAGQIFELLKLLRQANTSADDFFLQCKTQDLQTK